MSPTAEIAEYTDRIHIHHAMCEHCWTVLEGYRPPDRRPVEYRVWEECCRCGIPTHAGIYLRLDAMTPLDHCAGHRQQ